MNNFTKRNPNRTEFQIDILGKSKKPNPFDGGLAIEIDDHEHTLQFFMTKDDANDLYQWIENYLIGKNILHLYGGDKP